MIKLLSLRLPMIYGQSTSLDKSTSGATRIWHFSHFKILCCRANGGILAARGVQLLIHAPRWVRYKSQVYHGANRHNESLLIWHLEIQSGRSSRNWNFVIWLDVATVCSLCCVHERGSLFKLNIDIHTITMDKWISIKLNWHVTGSLP